MKFKFSNVRCPLKVFRTKKRILLLAMRTFILLFCTMAFGFNVEFSYSQEKVIIDSPKEITVDEVFQIIMDQTKYNFLYPENLFAGLPKVKLEKGTIGVDRLIARSIPDSMFNVILTQGNTIIIEKDASIQMKITGKVTDWNGVPISGATVFIKGTSKGTVTDFDGKYEIMVASQNNVLVFRSLGFKETEILVGKQLTINVMMEEQVTELEAVELVSTGYQRLSKERSAGSFSKPKLDIAKDRTYSMNILQRIDGLVAGLTVNNSPGAASNPYLIRGLTSIGTFNSSNVSNSGSAAGAGTNRSPLFVVDGIPTNNISYINPQDVDDITVLKDATASSIWGARAANGVIVVTTKKGENNSKLSINYDVFTNIQGRPDLGYQPYMDSPDFIKAAREVFDPESYPYDQLSAYVFEGSGIPPHLQFLYDGYRGVLSSNAANAKLDSLGNISNRGQIRKLWYREAMQTNHTLTLSAGGAKHAVYASLAYTDTKSTRPGDTDRLYKLNVRQDFKFNESIKAYLITDFTKTKALTKNNLDIDHGFFPYQLFRNSVGEHMSIPFMGMLSEEVRADFEARSRVDLNYNPLDERNYSDNKTDVFNGRFIGGVDIDILKNVSFAGTYSYNQGSNKTTNYTSPDSYIVRSELAQFAVADTLDVTPVYFLPDSGGRFTESNVSNKNYTIRNQLSFDKNWGEGTHQLSVLLGQEAQEYLTEISSTTVRGFNPLLQTYLSVDYAMLENLGVDNPVMPNSGSQSFLTDDNYVQSEVLSRFTSYYSNLGYTLHRKYTVNGSWRRDKSNLFGLDKSAQNKPSWSVGGKWSAGKEAFFQNVNWLDLLDLRATYGITGNAPTPGTSSSYDILRPQLDYDFLGNIVPLTIQTPGNPKLTWESTANLNLGLDIGLFDRIFASIDVYSKKTDNLLGQLPLNIFSGFSSAIGNFGAMENKGIELTLNTENVQSENFGWTTLFTMAYNKNKITELELPGEVSTGDQKVDLAYLKDYPAFAVFAYDYQGLDAEGDPLVRLNDGTITKEPNITSAEDILFMGTAQPVWSGGFSNSFRYKGFNLSVNAIYNLGHVMRKDVSTDFSGLLESVPYKDFAQRWKSPGDELVTDIPSFDTTGALSGEIRDVNYYLKGKQNVLDASYVKLRDITLSYGLPKDALNKMKIQDLTFRLSVSNILLWSANSYKIDPEFQFSSFGFGSRALRTNQGSIALGVHLSI
ncbi:SusC/RagA family TonB-linked outer membrane protein [Maribacter sp. X9]|uniref:SusC/RagA family TonB-linked outer membrane protein n=1 Tax=Maribacter sp. X9 TaxID=3402159 RepID=UPI003AF3503C